MRRTHVEKFRKDYTVSNYTITEVKLGFDIFEGYTEVTGLFQVEAHAESLKKKADLVLNGEDMELLSVSIDGVLLAASSYSVTDSKLTIPSVPERFTLETVVRIKPEDNKSGMGFYRSGDIYCSQCEPEGFRKITYGLDRSDVMAKYVVKITADKVKYPFLLSNGNKISTEDLADGRHRVTWEDPFPKPSYLFAIVVGDLDEICGKYTTMNGREVDLKIYVDKGNESRAGYAMESLINSMKWDEERFGLEYDLDLYQIVAVDSFNMGAMENKGLNVFNSLFVLADKESATDGDYFKIEAVVGHEYFHNWTGNRVTCRDWFQLTLKEGLTVFRDQEFSSDMNSRPVCRIAAVAGLRRGQFPEDAGPMAHPIRPDSYIEIDNFYTSTVYSKGAEVIRMIETFIGRENFRNGISKYFELYDGQAVTCDDFIHAMNLASGFDFTQFKRWYRQAGTPLVKVTSCYDAAANTYALTVEQSSHIATNEAFQFPLVVGLLDAEGNCIHEEVLDITNDRETFVFENIGEELTPSLLRNFSAPVKLDYDYTKEELIFLFGNDEDEFCRYEAGQRLAVICLNEIMDGIRNNEMIEVEDSVLLAFGSVIDNESLDEEFRASALSIPGVAVLCEEMDTPEFEVAFKAREFFRKAIALRNEIKFVSCYDRLKNLPELDKGGRALKNTCLGYLGDLEASYVNVMDAQFREADNMTDSIAALEMLCNVGGCCKTVIERESALQAFYDRWKDDARVMNKWFLVQASSKGARVLEKVKQLENNPAFDARNPNKLRALYSVFTANLLHFHAVDGEGYKFIADKIIEIDKFNPNVASGLAKGFKKYAVLDKVRKSLVKCELVRILENSPSDGLFEVVAKTLGQAK